MKEKNTPCPAGILTDSETQRLQAKDEIEGCEETFERGIEKPPMMPNTPIREGKKGNRHAIMAPFLVSRFSYE